MPARWCPARRMWRDSAAKALSKEEEELPLLCTAGCGRVELKSRESGVQEKVTEDAEALRQQSRTGNTDTGYSRFLSLLCLCATQLKKTCSGNERRRNSCSTVCAAVEAQLCIVHMTLCVQVRVYT